MQHKGVDKAHCRWRGLHSCTSSYGGRSDIKHHIRRGAGLHLCHGPSWKGNEMVRKLATVIEALPVKAKVSDERIFPR